MRVAVVTQYFPTSAQPWAGHSAYQTLRLLARRCDLRVFYPEGRYPAPLTPRSRTHGTLDGSYQPVGVPVTYVPYRVLPIISRPLNGYMAARALQQSVREFRPDLLLNYVVYPDGYAAVRLGQQLRVPVVLTAIGSDLNRISDPVCGALTRFALRRATVVTTVSGDLLLTARRLGADVRSSIAILNGCDTAVFHPRDKAEARRSLALPASAEIAVYVGRLDLRKGLLELIEAAAQVQQRQPGFRCYLVGDGPDKPLLTDAVARLHAETWLTFVPSCPTDQVAQWMAAADLITLPSYKEGCPNVVIEALASGRPVVATNVGGIPELMSSTSGRLVPPKDIPALATALHETLSSEWDAAALARDHCRSWHDVSDDLYQVLAATLKSRHPGCQQTGEQLSLVTPA